MNFGVLPVLDTVRYKKGAEDVFGYVMPMVDDNLFTIRKNFTPKWAEMQQIISRGVSYLKSTIFEAQLIEVHNY